MSGILQGEPRLAIHVCIKCGEGKVTASLNVLITTLDLADARSSPGWPPNSHPQKNLAINTE